MPGPLTQFELYVQPAVRKFSARHFTDLQDHLQRLDSGLSAVAYQQPEDLTLTADGVTERHGRRYSVSGFHTICRQLSFGLAPLLTDMFGIRGRYAKRPDLLDPVAAINIFNSLVRLRAELFRGQWLLVNATENTVDGLRHRDRGVAPLLQVCQTVEETAQQAEQSAGFYGAIVRGRRLSLYYREEPAVLTMPRLEQDPDGFYLGHYFTTGEAYWSTSVRATPALLSSDGVALRAPVRALTRRIRPERQLPAIAEAARASFAYTAGVRADGLLALQDRINTLVSTPITAIGQAGPEEHRWRKLGNLFRYRQLSVQLAYALIEQVLQQTSEGVPETETYQRLLQDRTLYDFYGAVLRQARQSEPRRRERLERFAYDLMAGKFTRRVV